MMVLKEKTINFPKTKTTTRCAVSEEKGKCTSFLRRFSRLVPSIEELDIWLTGILSVRGPLRVFKKVIFMFTREETTPLITK